MKWAAAFLVLLLTCIAQPANAACSDLVGAGGKGVYILSAREVSGSVTIPARWSQAEHEVPVPNFCRVNGVISQMPGSRIGFALWLPSQAWNHRLRMFGNGGYSSSLPIAQMAEALAQGYAVTASDTGHSGDDPDFAIGLPASIADWGYRAVHETIVAAKGLTRAFYGVDASHSYFDGCSTGGHQALMEAQRFPDDFDGIVAGAPGNNRTHLNAAFLWQFVVNHEKTPPFRQIIPPEKLRILHDWALKICRKRNGQTAGLASDAFIDDPLACRFDPEVAACKPGENEAQCLTKEQVSAARKMYDGTRNPRTGALIYPPWLPGSEGIGPADSALPGWSLYWADPTRPTHPARESFWRFWAFQPTWRWQDFDFDHDMTRVDARLAGVINAMSPDLAAFKAHGGKLIHYHGLADPVVSPWDSINYYRRVQGAMNGKTAGFYRLFLAPGVSHCTGGPGPDRFDTQNAIEDWVESGRAPGTIRSYNLTPEGVQNARPMCPYPEQAKAFSSGNGSPLVWQCIPTQHAERPVGLAYKK